MDVLFNVIGAGLVELGKWLCRSVCPKVKSFTKFSSNHNSLQKAMENLIIHKNKIEAQTQSAAGDGHLVKPEVLKWLAEVDAMQHEVNRLQEEMKASDKVLIWKCCPNCGARLMLASEITKKLKEVDQLKEAGCFPSGLVDENGLVRTVERIPVAEIQDPSSAGKNLAMVQQLLADDAVRRIGIWGMGGIGKTTLAKNLNNQLLNASLIEPFSVVIWATVSRNYDVRRVQEQIAERLNLAISEGDSVERRAGRIYRKLENEQKFLLILDDVWDAIDLSLQLGVPEDSPQSKVIITSRSLEICRQMRTDKEVKVEPLNEEESWELFTKYAGGVATQEDIQPLAKDVVKECGGLPLAIIVIGASMNRQTRIEVWEDALTSLQRSVPHTKATEDKVYRLLKWSYDSLGETYEMNVRTLVSQRENYRNKKCTPIQSLFLYCSLYPEDFTIEVKELVHSWSAEGLIDESQRYQELYNRGFAMVENLKRACLLEDSLWEGTVKMHDVVRDVAIWIASSLEYECKSLVRSGYGWSEILDVELPYLVKRVSFMANRIESLPDSLMNGEWTSTLFLQENLHLQTIPDSFLQAFQKLRVLNLSDTRIQELPHSLIKLRDLRSLLLRNCSFLVTLPPLGKLAMLQFLDCSNTHIRRHGMRFKGITRATITSEIY